MWRTVVDSGTTTQTHYVYDEAGRLLAEHDGATGAVRREYVWLDDTPLAMIDSTGASPAIYWLHAGQLDEPVTMTDAAGNTVWDGSMEPFGAAQVFGTPSIDLRLPGQFAEAEAGLFQNWNRNYDPSLGRYVEADPLGIEAGQNVYGYVDGSPLGLTDPRGTAFGDVTVGSAAVFAGFNLAHQLWLNHGNLACVDPGQVWQAAVNGALFGFTLEFGGLAFEAGSALVGSLIERFALADVGGIAAAGAADFSAIGSTGRVGEDWLAENFGEAPNKYFSTTQGARYVDQFANGIAHESKVGYTTLTTSVRSQIAKDVELMATQQVQGVTWHFFTSPVTNIGGPSAPLLRELLQSGIKVIVH